MELDEVIAEGKRRALKGMKKFPAPNYTGLKFAEESGEVIKEAVHFAEGRGSKERVIEEMCDALAMLFRLGAEGDGTIGLEPVFSDAEAFRLSGE